MGAADVVPGVSGGTIAFITGILDTLLNSIRRVNPKLFGVIKEKGIKHAFDYINGSFLICLFAGILTSIFTLAKLISYLLVHHPIPVWSFFFGLIVISVIHMLKQVERFTLLRMAIFLLGILAAYTITVLNPVAIAPSKLNIIFGGAIAICAMILPGISGSFILLLLGLYTPILAAVKNVDLSIISLFAIGAVCGLLTFSHVLSALLKHYHDATLIFLTGLMLGTLGKIWPWKQAVSFRINSHGEQVPLLEQNLLPWHYAQQSGLDSQLGVAIVCMLLGIGIVWGLEVANKKLNTQS